MNIEELRYNDKLHDNIPLRDQIMYLKLFKDTVVDEISNLKAEYYKLDNEIKTNPTLIEISKILMSMQHQIDAFRQELKDRDSELFD